MTEVTNRWSAIRVRTQKLSHTDPDVQAKQKVMILNLMGGSILTAADFQVFTIVVQWLKKCTC